MRTRTSLPKTAALAVGALLGGLTIPTIGQVKQPEPRAKTGSPFSSAQLTERALHRRAVVADIWGMPAVSMAGVQKSLAGIGADYDQAVYFSKPMEARHEFLTANNNTPYVFSALDTHGGPVVLDVPPASGNALYLDVTPEKNDGKTVYRLTVKEVPVDGFWSIGVYNAEGRFVKNERDAYRPNNITTKRDDDGSVTAQFGGCDGETPNCLPIMPGWNDLVRLYRPRKEILDGTWSFPKRSRCDRRVARASGHRCGQSRSMRRQHLSGLDVLRSIRDRRLELPKVDFS
jgi:hypothetical protein